MRNFTKNELNMMIKNHRHWILQDCCGWETMKADLRSADLSGADLRGADLRGATNVPFIPMTCPEEGSFIGWKKCDSGRIVKLEIQADARRSSSTGRKCRCSKAKVLSIESVFGDITFDNAISKYDPNFIYHVGEVVSVDNFCEDRFYECATGIHFFINRQEAVDHM